MKETLVAVVAALSALTAPAAAGWRNGEREPLWPAGKTPDFQPHQSARCRTS